MFYRYFIESDIYKKNQSLVSLIRAHHHHRRSHQNKQCIRKSPPHDVPAMIHQLHNLA
jgi:hypothetical protein